MLATKYNPIYWNTACLQVNSGSLDIEDEKSTDYGKIARAIGDITNKGIKVSLVDINKSKYSFIPDVENNQILFGMKALNGVGAAITEKIIENRPYTSMIDFMNKTQVNKTVMISLIKSGSFDGLEDKSRTQVMAEYLWLVCGKKKRITLQNFNALVEYNLLPQELDFQKRVFVYNKFLKQYCKKDKYYLIINNYLDFYEQFFDMDELEIINGDPYILQTKWEKIYKKVMTTASNYFKEHQSEMLDALNKAIFKEFWDKYAAGSIAAWEMSSLGFYYTYHELKDVNIDKYGIVDFFELPDEPLVEYFFKRNGKEIPVFQTFKIIGTVIAKNDIKSTVTLLTTNGVVPVKFSKEYFAKFNRQISEYQDNGTKKVMEKSWFTRGAMLMVTGIRRGDQFQAKTYKNTPSHKLYKITEVNGEDIELIHIRYGEHEDD